MTVEPGHMLNDRYVIERQIGVGGQGRTYLARDATTETKVVVKEFDLRRTEDWKSLELFEREAEALRDLDHPGIPDYIDEFVLEDDRGRRDFLVQEFIEGTDYETLVEKPGQLLEPEIRRVLEEVLDILDYLHAHEPPIIHRDIKPANLIRGTGFQITLVDFGAISRDAPGAIGGSTMVGTAGYLAPEQLRGRAAPATDLYGLAATVVHLASGRPPIELQTEGFRLEFRDAVELDDELADLLESMLEPDLDARISTIEEVRRRLELSGAIQVRRRRRQLPISQPDSSNYSQILTAHKGEQYLEIQSERLGPTKLFQVFSPAAMAFTLLGATGIGGAFAAVVESVLGEKTAEFFYILATLPLGGAAAVLCVVLGLAYAAVTLRKLGVDTESLTEFARPTVTFEVDLHRNECSLTHRSRIATFFPGGGRRDVGFKTSTEEARETLADLRKKPPNLVETLNAIIRPLGSFRSTLICSLTHRDAIWLYHTLHSGLEDAATDDSRPGVVGDAVRKDVPTENERKAVETEI